MLTLSLSSRYQINFGFEQCFASDKSSKPASIMLDDVQIQTAQRSPSQFLVQNNSPVQFSIIIPVTKCILIQALLDVMKHIVWSCSFPKGMYWGPSTDIASVPCVQLPQYVGLNARLNRTLRTNTKSSVPQIRFAFSKEIHVEKVHKFSSSGGELKEGHDALNLAI